MKVKLTVSQYKKLKQIGLLKETSHKIKMKIKALKALTK